MYFLTILVSGSESTAVPRLVRMYFALWLMRRWRLPATPARTLPVPVTLKRFLAPDLVFILGILRSSLLVFLRVARKPSAFMNRLGMPFGRAVRIGAPSEKVDTTFSVRRRDIRKIRVARKGRPERWSYRGEAVRAQADSIPRVTRPPLSPLPKPLPSIKVRP